MKKKLLIILISIMFIFIVFIIEESIRLNKYSDAKPLIILKKDVYTHDNFFKQNHIYYSLCFKLKQTFILDDNSSDDNKIYYLSGEEFILFNKLKLWAWIS